MPDEDQPWGGPLWAAADLYTPMAVRVAATLRVADLIADGVTSGAALAERLDVAADPLVRVLDHLVTAGFLAREGDRYALTDDGQWLRGDHPQGIRAWVDLDGALGHGDTSAVELLHTVRTGEPAFDRRFGTGFWEDLAANPERAASFDALMGDQGDRPDELATAYDWAALGQLVDVGGGDATLLLALLRAHPNLHGTVVELAGPAAAAERAIAAEDLDDRADVVAASFFDPLPAGAGGYVLSRVIHDWDDQPAARILRRCAEAAGKDGRVLVIETIDDSGTVSTEMDLRMLTYVNGRERDLDGHVELGLAAGLDLAATVPVGRRTILEFTPQ